MPQTKIDNLCFSGPRKCDVPAPTFDSANESSPDSSPPFNGFFRSGQPSKSGANQDIINGRKTEDNVTHSTLSVLSNDCNGDDTTHNCDLGLHPSHLLNGQCSSAESVNVGNKNKHNSKSTLFSDSLLTSLTSKPFQDNNMKISNDSTTQINQDFSDLLSSISLPVHKSKQNSEILENFKGMNERKVDVESFKTSSSYPDILKRNGFVTQNNDTFSDILSLISFDEHKTSIQTGQNSLSLLSSDSSQYFKNNQIPNLHKLDPEFSKLNSFTTVNTLKQDDCESNLSDILSSISFDEIDTSMQNGFISSSNSSPSLDDIPILNEPSSDFSMLNFHIKDKSSKLNSSDFENNGNLSDIFSSITFNENSNTTQNGLHSIAFFSSDPSPSLKNDSLSKVKQNSKLLEVDDKVKLPTDKPTDSETSNFPLITNPTLNSNIQKVSSSKSHIDDKTILSSSISTPESSDHINVSQHDEKNTEFSFFSVSPDNVFSAMLSNLNKTSDVQDKNTNECSADISMLDLLKSVNTDSDGSLSEFLRTPSESKERNTDTKADDAVLDDINEILNIDLSTCIKTNDNSVNDLHKESPIDKDCAHKNDGTKIKLEEFVKPIFDKVDSYCPKRPRMNLNQSLFAKSLSSKPKKNRILLQKVALIKCELYEHYFNHPIPEDAELKMNENLKTIKDNEMVICKTNTCMITFKGRRLCPQEVQ